MIATVITLRSYVLDIFAFNNKSVEMKIRLCITVCTNEKNLLKTYWDKTGWLVRGAGGWVVRWMDEWKV